MVDQFFMAKAHCRHRLKDARVRDHSRNFCRLCNLFVLGRYS